MTSQRVDAWTRRGFGLFWGIALVALAAGPVHCAAETVYLKSGQKIEGKIVERTDAYVRLDLEGLPLTYFMDEVDRIEEEKPVASKVEPPVEKPLTAVMACAGSPDYLNEWIGASFDQTVKLERVDEAMPGQTLYVSVVVGGFAVSDKGAVDLAGDFEVLDPDGNVVFSDENVFRHTAASGAAAHGFVMLDPAVDVKLDRGNPGGRYTLRAVVRDRISSRSVTATHTVLLKKEEETTLPSDGFKTIDEFVRWMTYYYVKPDPGKAAAAFKFYMSSELFKKEAARRPAAAFFAELWRSDAGQVKKLREEAVAAGPGDIQTFIRDVLFLINTAESREALAGFAVQAPAAAAPDLLKDSIEDAGQLDMLWAAFMATGSEAYVKRIIEVVPWGKEGKGFKKLIGTAAAWSLKSNVKQHARVAEICRQALASSNGILREDLNAILSASPQK